MSNHSAVSFGRSCQSPRTGFAHLFAGEAGGDAIPIYENFCFAIALIRQKTAEGVYEGKDLLERLYAFQAPESFPWAGNFPIYLHDFPRCWNPFQPLRIAPLLIQLLREFGHVLGEEFCQKTKLALDKLLACLAKRRTEKAFEPLWEKRYQALLGNQIERAKIPTSSTEWAEELISEQLGKLSCSDIARLVHPELGYSGPSAFEAQEGASAALTLLDAWMGRSSRPHPILLEQAALFGSKPEDPSLPWSGRIGDFQLRHEEGYALSYAPSLPAGLDAIVLRLLWGGSHSLVIPTNEFGVQIEERGDSLRAVFDLPQAVTEFRHDLVEVALYCNLSHETEVLIGGKKGTAFASDQIVSIKTPQMNIEVQFKLIEGEGEFFGHISRSNRPFQKSCKGALTYEAFDWKIGLRTLRRSAGAKILMTLTSARLQNFARL